MKPYFAAGGVELYLGDCREVLPQLQVQADAAVTDPPYAETSLAWDRWVSGWVPLLAALLKPSASLWSFGSFKMFIERMPEFVGWRIAQDLVWEKHNGSGFHADRFKRVHELAVQFYRQSARWDDVYKNPIKTMDAVAKAVRRKKRPPHMGAAEYAGVYVSEDGGPRFMRSVIYARSCHGYAENETQKPEEIVEPLVRYSVPPGGLVIDCFAGSGTTLVSAVTVGRRAIGVELREAQCEVAARRVQERIAQHPGLV
jgi:site-specific DNA-methyltransferase (adenine-specific)